MTIFYVTLTGYIKIHASDAATAKHLVEQHTDTECTELYDDFEQIPLDNRNTLIETIYERGYDDDDS